ncbi:hypothetical protein COPG_00081 [Colwellia phage 9A]|uniref:Uncharacterized protein n=1 Tax=Colwellia phage 9A TaxID=765765 RepID=I3UMG2_9CAUD|nr:hypothetical protein COPG_00081 [Colwellia phage 9A]AFK66677.1 hypothetical protein COPG_00081 [Colwellia phage 9A]
MKSAVELLRKLLRQRRNSSDERVVGIDQSLSNCACVLFVNGVPTERVVFHTGSTDTKDYKAKIKRGDTIFGEFMDAPVSQVTYLTGEVIKQLIIWNPNYVCLEGLAFNATGKTERQLAGLYHSIFTSLHRELGYCLDTQLITVTPHQAKKIARSYLPEEDQYLRELTARNTPKLNPMDKKAMGAALKCTDHAWILDGYTRKTLVASRNTETGIEDLPDAYFIALFFIENKSVFIK